MARRTQEELSDRQREILQAVVEDYIATAEPVGSRSLTKRHKGIDVSPATGAEVETLIREVYASPPEAVRLAAESMKPFKE